MKSLAVVFGEDRNLVGIVLEPDSAPAHDVAFILFNSGVLPRVGPHRINVRIAQRLADEGRCSLRFDLSGQGDSRAAAGQENYLTQAITDIRSAMDHLESNLGIRRFALIGVCSGALSSYWAALEDARIVGVLMFDGCWYRTRWTSLIEHWKRIQVASPVELLSAAGRRLLPKNGKHAATRRAAAGLFDAEPGSATPPKAQFAQGLQRLVDRGVAVCLVYSGSIIDYYSYAAQFRHAFAGHAFLSSVRCDFRPDIDHTFLLLETQSKMLDLVAGWVPEVARAAGNTA